MTKIGLFPGSFDPFTLGHKCVVDEALKIFDKIIIAIGYNFSKKGFLEIDKRKQLIEDVYKNDNRVEVTIYSSLTIDEALRVGATSIIRSVRNVNDFEYENNIAMINYNICPDIQTVVLLTPPQVKHISSSLVRELYFFKHDIKNLLPEGITLEKYF